MLKFLTILQNDDKSKNSKLTISNEIFLKNIIATLEYLLIFWEQIFSTHRPRMKMGEGLTLNCCVLINLRSSHLSYDILAEEPAYVQSWESYLLFYNKKSITEPYLNIHMIQALEKLLGCFVIKYVCILMNALEQLLAYLPYVAYASWKFVFYGNSFHFGIYFGMFNYVKFSACVNTPVHLKSLHHKWNVNI